MKSIIAPGENDDRYLFSSSTGNCSSPDQTQQPSVDTPWCQDGISEPVQLNLIMIGSFERVPPRYSQPAVSQRSLHNAIYHSSPTIFVQTSV